MAHTNSLDPEPWCCVQAETPPDGVTFPKTEVILRSIPASGEHPGTLVRLAGDRYVMVEYGPMELDLNLRVRVWALEKHLAEQKVRAELCEMIGEPITRLAYLIGEPIILTGKRAPRKALGAGKLPRRPEL